MEKLNQITSQIIPMIIDNIDTDQIMPKAFIKRISRSGYEDVVFFEDRYLDKNMTPNPNFVLNKDEYQGAKILVTGKNFGSGSSREHAVWGLENWGIKVVIGGSFSDIFFMNCTQNAVLPIVIEDESIRQDLASLPASEQVTVDLPAQTITSSLGVIHFDIDETIKHKLINGIDDIQETLQYEDLIKAYEDKYDSLYPPLTFD